MSRTPQARWMMRLMVLLNPSSGPIGLLTLQAFKVAGGTRAVCVDGIAKRRDRAALLPDLPSPLLGLRQFADAILEVVSCMA
jgi:hypothetical protein